MDRSRATCGGRTAVALRALVLIFGLWVVGSGCAQTAWVRVREVPANPLTTSLNLLSPGGPKPTDRTMLVVRRYGLEEDLEDHNPELLVKLTEFNRQQPSTDKVYSLAELAYLSGKRAEPTNRKRALELHGLAVVHAYQYLFDDKFGRYRNPFDPEFRGACDLYNGALESTLRIIQKQNGLVPGATKTIQTANQSVDVTVVLCGNTWRAEDFAGFRFVSDYEIRGLQNQYHNYGLGVPLIAERKRHANASPEEKFYPPGMSFPVTAFLRVMPGGNPTEGHHRVHLELYDPLNASEINVDGRRVPLESDLTAPLAYALNQKELQDLDSSTAGLLDPAKAAKLQGLYMLEPYQPGKIPVVMIHGLWSSPITWMEMFNDLRGAPEIRDRYQFWFYLYPTGQPFWYSASQMRKDLAEARTIIDPHYRQPALDHMVLVGHSMGGLVARLQTIESGNDFWNIVSEQSFQQVKATEETKRQLANTFFFRPNPAIQRVISIGTPFRGSDVANSTTRWLGNKLIEIPQKLVSGRQQLYKENPDLFRPHNLIDVNTSIDSLAPDSPILPVMLAAPQAPWVKYHNIAGNIPDKGIWGSLFHGSDGVVPFTSSHLDNVASELVVNADHLTIHRHPLSILEVHRVLLEHLSDIDRQPPSRLERPPVTASTSGVRPYQPGTIAAAPPIPVAPPSPVPSTTGPVLTPEQTPEAMAAHPPTSGPSPFGAGGKLPQPAAPAGPRAPAAEPWPNTAPTATPVYR